MFEDPVVEEVHDTRERLLERHGGLEGLVRYVREIEIEMKERVVSPRPETPEPRREVG